MVFSSPSTWLWRHSFDCFQTWARKGLSQILTAEVWGLALGEQDSSGWKGIEQADGFFGSALTKFACNKSLFFFSFCACIQDYHSPLLQLPVPPLPCRRCNPLLCCFAAAATDLFFARGFYLITTWEGELQEQREGRKGSTQVPDLQTTPSATLL